MTTLAAVFLFFLILVINLLLWSLVCIWVGLIFSPVEGDAKAMYWMTGIAGLVTTCMEFAAGWFPPV